MIRDEERALQEICELLPPGYVKYVPFSVERSVSFDFNGVTVLMSPLVLNEYLNCYTFDLSWGSTDKIYGIPVRCGTDILSQYTTPLPNMFASNHVDASAEVTDWRDLTLFVIDMSVLGYV